MTEPDLAYPSISSQGEMMPKRKVRETLDFVKGLLGSADEISRGLSGKLEPRMVLAQQQTTIANLSSEQIEDLGKYQGRVVLIALAAELALKFLWETENKGGAPPGHNLQRCFELLTDDYQKSIRSAYRRRVMNPLGREWKTIDQVFQICSDAFEDWRYIVEEGSYPNYIMRATHLRDATLSVLDVAYTSLSVGRNS